MRERTIALLKIPIWLVCLSPLAEFYYGCVTGRLGADPARIVCRGSGEEALWLLILSLTISPVRKLIPRLQWLVRFRRLLGLFAFFYACLHVLAYVVLEVQVSASQMISDFSKHIHLLVGAIAWLLLIPLAATSTSHSIACLGGRRWQALHRLTYVTAVLSAMHYWLSMKTGSLKPLKVAVALVIVLGARPALAWLKESRPAASP